VPWPLVGHVLVPCLHWWPGNRCLGEAIIGQKEHKCDIIEKFVKEGANVQVSHGICPTCMEKLYPKQD